MKAACGPPKLYALGAYFQIYNKYVYLRLRFGLCRGAFMLNIKFYIPNLFLFLPEILFLIGQGPTFFKASHPFTDMMLYF